MGFDKQYFAAESGLTYDKASHCFWGTVSRYPIFVQRIPRSDNFTIRLNAKQFSEENLKPVMQQWQSDHLGVHGLYFKDRTLICNVSKAAKEPEKKLLSLLADLTAFAAEHKLIPCCMCCGKESGFSHMLLDHSGVALCEPCVPHVEKQLADAAEKQKQKKPHYFGIVFSIVLCSVLTVLLCSIILRYSTMTVLTGAAAIFASIVLMRKLGKKLTLPSVIVCCICIMLSLTAAALLDTADTVTDLHVSHVEDMQDYCTTYEQYYDTFVQLTDADKSNPAFQPEDGMEAVTENYESFSLMLQCQTVPDTLRHLPELMRLPQYAGSNIRKNLIRSIIVGLLSVLLTAAVIVPRMLREDAGVHTLRKLEKE